MKKRFILFQILRAFALISVYIYHQGLADEVFSRWGVCCFFILSGFLNAYHLYGALPEAGFKSSVSFGLGRIKKIFPLHIVMLTVAFLGYAAGHLSEITQSISRFASVNGIKLILNALLVSDWIPHIAPFSDINGEYNIVTWFLSAMLLFYILTPIMLKLMHRLYDSRKVSPVLGMAVIYAYVITVNIIYIAVFGRSGSFWHIYESPVSRIGDYLIGAHLGLICLQYGDSKRPEGFADTSSKTGKTPIPLILTCLLNAVFIAIPAAGFFGTYKFLVSSGFYFTVPVSLLIILLALREKEKVDAGAGFPGKALVWIGDLSPYIFLVHYPVITGVHGILKRIGDVNIWIWSLLSLIITLALSYAYMRLIKRK